MPNKPRTPLAALAIACLLATGAAHAQDAFHFSGFGTVGASITDTDKAEFVTPGQPGNGATKEASFAPDTKLGLQASYRFNSVFSATAQVLTKYTGAGDWDPALEWAFVKAQPAAGWTIRLGRMGAPIFAISDFREVNFANTWVRPPLEVYSQVALSSFDGADVSYQHSFDSAVVTATVFGGEMKSNFNNAEVTLKNEIGFNVTAELESGLTLRAGYSQGELRVAGGRIASLLAGTNQLASNSATALIRAGLPAALSDAAAALDARKRASFSGVGASWDINNWLLNAEYTWRRADHYISDSTGWYASVGRRIGKVTPYIYYAELKVDELKLNNPITATDINAAAGLLAGLRAPLAGLAGGYAAVAAGQDFGQKTVAVGARWDAFKSVAFKAQLEHIKPQSSNAVANGLFLPADSTTNLKGKSVNVFTLSADFVF
ncbi:MAG: hypothetical protein ACOZD0_02310 [Pseudomonadota bacterium]